MNRLSRTASIISLVMLTCLLIMWSGHRISSAASLSVPVQEVAWASPTHYGERLSRDAFGITVRNPYIVVIHETVGSADSTINLFQASDYTKNGSQVSYHALIRLNGTIVYTVPLKYRAFGAADSVFVGANGPESVQTNAQVSPSVNNFAYHFSLETPLDGRNNANTHSGYTDSQYRSLAWLVRYTKVPKSRITYHKAIDLTHTRKDPRSFNQNFFFGLLNAS